MESEPKLCECGCGKPAPIAKGTSTRDGWIKGMPVRFISGHWARTSAAKRGHEDSQWKGGRTQHTPGGYIRVKREGHPRATKGYVLEHIVVAEEALGHYLPLTAEVHHVNERKGENKNVNLVICQDRAYHALLHQRLRAYRATGNPSALKCNICKEWGTDVTAKRGRNPVHLHCRRAYMNKRYHASKLRNV